MTFHDDLVAPTATGLPDRFFDRFVFNLHAPDSTDLSLLVGCGLYPPADVVDGFVVLVHGGRQRNLRFSTELSATDGSGVGPFGFRVVEPMTTWALTLADNPTGVAFDLVWRARTPAWSGDVAVPNGAGPASSFEHLFQSGRYEGTVTVDGREHDVTGWFGQRDRSRGVRTMSGGQGLHLWFQAQFPDRSVGFLLVEDRDHGRILLEGAVMHEDGGLDPIADVVHDLVFDDLLDLRSGRVRVTTATGEVMLVDADGSADGGFMAGAGYGGGHGHPVGRDHLEHDEYPLDGTVGPRTLDSALTDRLAAFDWAGVRGTGVFEFAHSRSPRYGYRSSL
ncbi:hypothetical protein F1C76_20225 [Geodermatophilaceae bacterium NBWT11]|nr:hypothetical protein F1C76_20225 [Geodermatophilaceae bacterium NBWT11]